MLLDFARPAEPQKQPLDVARVLGHQRLPDLEGIGLVVVSIDGDMQQVIGVHIDRQVNVHPPLHFLRRLVVLGHQDILFVDADHAAGTDHTKERCDGQKFVSPGADPAVDGRLTDLQRLAQIDRGTFRCNKNMFITLNKTNPFRPRRQKGPHSQGGLGRRRRFAQ